MGLLTAWRGLGGNITGFTIIEAVLAGKRLELLKETIPKLSRVAVLWDPQDRGSTQQWKESQLRHENWACNFIRWKYSSADKFEGAFKEATKAGSAALAVTQSRVYQFLSKSNCGPGGKISAAGDLRSGRFCRERRLDVLRGRPDRTLQARRR